MSSVDASALRALVESLQGASRDDRDAILCAARQTDSALADNAERCIASLDCLEGFLEPPVGAAIESLAAELAMKAHAGDRVGPYRLVRPLGAGGMGSVYYAVRDDGVLSKEVAVKLVSHELQSAASHERFMRERSLLARLEHSNIARVIDAGVADSGAPYVVMEYVDGRPIDEHCRLNSVRIHERLRLIEELCAAVQHAHRQLVVHGDIKPQNVLVTADHCVKLVDFGVSQPLDGVEVRDDGFSPRYAGPERAPGAELTTSADIYSLGVLLYDMVFTEHASPADLRSRAPRTLRDLGFIVTRCTQPDPELRYASVEQFASDIRRYRRKEPVLARRRTLPYLTACLVRRNRVATGAIALAASGLTVATAISAWSLLEARSAAAQAQSQREAAEVARQRSDQVGSFLREVLASADPYGAESNVDLKHILASAEQRIDAGEFIDPLVEADLRLALAQSQISLWDWNAVRRLTRPAVRLLEASPRDAAAVTEKRIEARRLLGRSLSHLGLDEGLKVSRAAFEEARLHYGLSSPEVAEALAELAFAQWNIPSQRNDRLAEADYRQALAMLENQHELRAPDVGRIAFSYAAFLQSTNRDREAINQFERAARAYRASERTTERYLIECLHRYSVSLIRLDDRPGALRALSEALALVPPSAVDWSTTLMHWRRASLLVAAGEFEQAAPALYLSLEHELRYAISRSGPRAFEYEALLAELHAQDSASAPSPALGLQACRSLRKLGDTSSLGLRFLSLGEFHARSDSPDRTDDLLVEVMTLFDEHSSDQRILRAVAQMWLAECRREQGRTAEALSLLSECGLVFETLLPTDHFRAAQRRAVVAQLPRYE